MLSFKALRFGGSSLLCLTMLFVSAGCGDGANLPELYETAGTATSGDTVLYGCTVQMTPTAGGRPSYGKIDKDNRFVMRCTRDAFGSTSGENVVVLLSPDPAPDAEPMTPERKRLFDKYGEGKSPLKVNIEEDTDSLELKFD